MDFEESDENRKLILLSWKNWYCCLFYLAKECRDICKLQSFQKIEKAGQILPPMPVLVDIKREAMDIAFNLVKSILIFIKGFSYYNIFEIC